MNPTEPLVICTAWTQAYAEIGKFCSESITQHIRRVEERGGSGIRMVTRIIPEDYYRPASWWKLFLIRELLQHNPSVLWIDCDALLIDQGDIREGINFDKSIPLQITRDVNGLNAGVMFWNAGDSAINLLQRIEDLSTTYRNHPWWETAAFNEDFLAHPEDYLEIDKSVYNAYTGEIFPGTKILHLAGFENSERLKMMEAFSFGLRRNGHGTPR